jgi:hypothetical protein
MGTCAKILTRNHSKLKGLQEGEPCLTYLECEHIKKAAGTVAIGRAYGCLAAFRSFLKYNAWKELGSHESLSTVRTRVMDSHKTCTHTHAHTRHTQTQHQTHSHQTHSHRHNSHTHTNTHTHTKTHKPTHTHILRTTSRPKGRNLKIFNKHWRASYNLKVC